ncbi:MAG: hypothetical protein ACOZFS_01645 [Thermodesulfobacteriota bacterium]
MAGAVGPLQRKRLASGAQLHETGVNGIFEMAREHGFKDSGKYLSKCHLCLDILRFLVLDRQLTFPELAPRGFYENL